MRLDALKLKLKGDNSNNSKCLITSKGWARSQLPTHYDHLVNVWFPIYFTSKFKKLKHENHLRCQWSRKPHCPTLPVVCDVVDSFDSKQQYSALRSFTFCTHVTQSSTLTMWSFKASPRYQQLFTFSEIRFNDYLKIVSHAHFDKRKAYCCKYTLLFVIKKCMPTDLRPNQMTGIQVNIRRSRVDTTCVKKRIHCVCQLHE